MAAKEATIVLQVIHSSLVEGECEKIIPTFLLLLKQTFIAVPACCLKTREQFAKCKESYAKLAALVPVGQYYRYNDHWYFLTQRLVFLIALTIYLEAGFLVTRDTVADILGRKLTIVFGHWFRVGNFHDCCSDCSENIAERWLPFGH